MRFICLVLLALFPALHTKAQKTFSQKDFNKLKRLADYRSLQSNTELPIYEAWEVANDSLLNGIWYRIAEDTNYLPEANIKLYYENNKIALALAYTGKYKQTPETFTFNLKSIDQGIYTFANIADTLSGEAMKQLKEIFLITIAYDCSKKDRITAQRQYIVPNTGLQTVRYVFKKD